MSEAEVARDLHAALAKVQRVLAARIDAEMKRSGLVVATADLLIGTTALHYGYAIGTRNVRHFNRIPGLQVLSL